MSDPVSATARRHINMTGADGGLSGDDARDALRRADGVLVDWDGTCAVNNRLLHRVGVTLSVYQEKLTVVSNNSSHLPNDFVRWCADGGLALKPRQIVLAGVKALNRAASLSDKNTRTLVLGDPRMRAYGKKMGLNQVREEADIVVLLRDVRFSYSRLERAANALLDGAKLIVANPDATHPGRDGLVVPETGALLAALAACVDLRQIDMEVIGKPQPTLFEEALATLGVPAERAVMIGDNPDTDMKGAMALGIPGIWVGLGDDRRPALADLLGDAKTA